MGVAKEAAQGTVIWYGKRRFASTVIGGATYVCATAVAVITNATRVVRSCKLVYTSVGYAMEAAEDASCLPFLPLDLVLFGQPVPANKDRRLLLGLTLQTILIIYQPLLTPSEKAK